MIKTYDFIPIVQRNKEFMEQIRKAVLCDIDNVICIDIFRLSFDGKKKTVTIRPFSETSDFHWKIVAKEVTFQALIKMIEGDWDNIGLNDIKDVWT